MSSKTIASNEVTFFDYTDSDQFTLNIKSNLPNFQLFNGSTYIPDWSSTNLVLTFDAYLQNQQVSPSVKWYSKIGNLKVQISTSTTLTINQNAMISGVGTIIYICEATYLNYHAEEQIIFTKLNTNYVPSDGGTFEGEIKLNGNVKSNGIYNQVTTVAANLYVGATNDYTIKRSSSSSKKYKHNIDILKSAEINSDNLYQLPVREFVYNDGYLGNNDKRANQIIPGFIAEEIAEIYPIACEYDSNDCPENWNIKFIVPAMLDLIQKQKQEINELRNELDTIKNILNKESL